MAVFFSPSSVAIPGKYGIWPKVWREEHYDVNSYLHPHRKTGNKTGGEFVSCILPPKNKELKKKACMGVSRSTHIVTTFFVIVRFFLT